MTLRTRTEIYAVSFKNAEAAQKRADELNDDPPPGKWAKGKFRPQSQRSVLTRRRTWTVIGEREL